MPRPRRKQLPPIFPHGSITHFCLSSRSDCYRDPLRADFPIRIERIGGGASPEGFAALVWPDELHSVGLMTNDNDDRPVEDWTEHGCFHLAYQALLSQHGRMNEPQLTDFGNQHWTVREVLSSFGVSWQLAAIREEIFQTCFAIDHGGLLS